MTLELDFPRNSAIYTQQPPLRLGSTKKALSEAEFIVPDWGDKVNSGIGLPYRPFRLQRLAGWYDLWVRQSYARVNYIPLSWTMNLAYVHCLKVKPHELCNNVNESVNSRVSN